MKALTVKPCSGPMICTIPIFHQWAELKRTKTEHTLTLIGHSKVGQPKFLHVFFQSNTLCPWIRLINERRDIGKVLAGRCSENDVIIMVRWELEKTYGTLWSTVARVQSGRRTERPALRLEKDELLQQIGSVITSTHKPSNACGLVTSWTRWLQDTY